MKAGRDAKAAEPPLRYSNTHWGELIEGTKEQLQALGLGVGRAFPGEVGGPRGNGGELKVIDPRGFPVRISNRFRDEGRFTAYVSYPNWPERPDRADRAVQIAPGVVKTEQVWGDVYTGRAADLEAAGLVQRDQLPGAPGMRKTRVVVGADGMVALRLVERKYQQPGAKSIERRSAKTFMVTVTLTSAERTRRQDASDAAEHEWERRVRGLRRPAKLQPIADAKLARMQAAQASAAKDTAFQGMLARLVAAAVAQPRPKDHP